MADSRQRRSSAEVTVALRAAIAAELAERGYSGVTFEGVARRAGTSKPVVYRRFSSRAAMVLEVLVPEQLGKRPAPDTGTLVGDLTLLGAEVIANFNAPGLDTIRGIMAEVDAATIARLTAVSGEFTRLRIGQVIERARARGELGEGEVSPRVAGAFVALVRHEIFFGVGATSPEQVDEVIREVYIPLLQHVTGVASA